MKFLNKEIQRLLAKAAGNIISEAKKGLKDGDLKNSLGYKLKRGSVQIIMEEYGIFKDRGVSGANHSDFNGKKKAIHKSLDNFKFKGKTIGGAKDISKWMQRRGIQGGNNTNFLIRRSIAQHGIKPSLFLTKPYEKYIDLIQQEFNNLQQDIKKDINGNN